MHHDNLKDMLVNLFSRVVNDAETIDKLENHHVYCQANRLHCVFHSYYFHFSEHHVYLYHPKYLPGRHQLKQSSTFTQLFVTRATTSEDRAIEFGHVKFSY